MKLWLAFQLRPVLIVPIFMILLQGNGFTQDPCGNWHSKKVDKVYDNGITYFKKGNYLEAGQIMKSVINSEPGYVDAYYVLGLVNFKKANSNFKEAEKNFQKVLQLCPSYDIHTYYYLAEICYSSERFDSTIQYLTEFLKDEEKIKSDKDYNRASLLLNYSKFYLEMTLHHFDQGGGRYLFSRKWLRVFPHLKTNTCRRFHQTTKWRCLPGK